MKGSCFLYTLFLVRLSTKYQVSHDQAFSTCLVLPFGLGERTNLGCLNQRFTAALKGSCDKD